MRWRRTLLLAPLAAVPAVALVLAPPAAVVAQPAPPPAEKAAAALPTSRVVLFNSGVGYFSREGTVEGAAKVDLSFRERDVNDLIKSMTLRDFDGGQVTAVAYDSREPVSRTLASFAVNLSMNPSLAQILAQTRGEKIEVEQGGSKVAGVNVGVEKQKVPGGPNAPAIDAEFLNVLTAEGLRSLRLSEVGRVKFLNPTLESDLRRALDVLALSHDSQKKSVSIQFAGEGKRRVQVSYVTEAPIWKTSYRLALAEDGQPQLQGWAVVENTTDEDWNNVRVALVAGRPVSFQMDLYNPLYVPRPVVEPELFASLRPPSYQGGFGARGRDRAALAQDQAEQYKMQAMNAPAPAAAPALPGPGGAAGFGLAESDARKSLADRPQARRHAENLGRELSERMNLGSVQSAATAGQLGDSYQYLIDHPVTLPRQKSALLPIVADKKLEGSRISIYNASVQPKHPLLGLRFKNTSGVNLAQGPVTIYEGSTYAGDARLPDVQPNEERLLAFAIDLGTEVDNTSARGDSFVVSVKADKGVVVITSKLVEERTYKIANRTSRDRVMVIEHPNRGGQEYKLVETPKPMEETPEYLRFQTAVPANKEASFTVKEERPIFARYELTNSGDDAIRYILAQQNVSPALQAKLKEAVALRDKWNGHQRDEKRLTADIQRLTQDQERIRRNLRETPRDVPLYKTYVEKLTAQEAQMDTLTKSLRDAQAGAAAARETFEKFVAAIGE